MKKFSMRTFLVAGIGVSLCVLLGYQSHCVSELARDNERLRQITGCVTVTNRDLFYAATSQVEPANQWRFQVYVPPEPTYELWVNATGAAPFKVGDLEAGRETDLLVRYIESGRSEAGLFIRVSKSGTSSAAARAVAGVPYVDLRYATTFPNVNGGEPRGQHSLLVLHAHTDIALVLVSSKERARSDFKFLPIPK